MSKIKKSVVLILAILMIIISVNSNIFASTIQQRPVGNNTSNNASNNASNNVANNAASNNATNNVTNNAQSLVGNNNTNSAGGGLTNNNTVRPINTSNTAENLPYTGIGDKYFNFILVILLAVVLGMFSFVQYNKITKKEDQD